jgi:SNF2 family DNA or RNA helicase
MSDELYDQISALPKEERDAILFIEKHPSIKMHWIINCFDPMFVKDFPFLNGRRVLNAFRVYDFVDVAEQLGYEIVWIDNPEEDLAWVKELDADPDVEIFSDLPGTHMGFIPFQIQGFNFLKNRKAGIVNWSTGTGKTVVSCALAAHHHKHKNYDVCFWVVKAHNKINTQRTIEKLVGMPSIVIDGVRKSRTTLYEESERLIVEGKRPIVILNYEKFRDDPATIMNMIEDRKVFIVWDEMPTKLKNRTTKLYRSVLGILYKNKNHISEQTIRPKELRQLMLSATPIENDPEDFFNCVRILDPSVYGSIKEFHSRYVARFSSWGYNKPSRWKDLDLMGAKAAYITHQVDKNDPDIAKQFPEVIDDTIYIDMSKQHQEIYDILMGQYRDDFSEEEIGSANILARINVAQMLINHPESLIFSAEARKQSIVAEMLGEPEVGGSELARRLVEAVGVENIRKAEASKLEALGDILGGLDETQKVIVFTAMNASLIPILHKALRGWKYDHVVYHGSLSMAQKQEAEDRFKNDPNCRIFVSSDAGSDSINLEIADIVIHYDLPWKWSTLIQRQNRAHRITSEHKHVRFYSLMVANTIEERKRMKILQKEEFHEQVLKGSVSEISGGARMSKKDLEFILFGK